MTVSKKKWNMVGVPEVINLQPQEVNSMASKDSSDFSGMTVAVTIPQKQDQRSDPI